MKSSETLASSGRRKARRRDSIARTIWVDYFMRWLDRHTKQARKWLHDRRQRRERKDALSRLDEHTLADIGIELRGVRDVALPRSTDMDVSQLVAVHIGKERPSDALSRDPDQRPS